ncbi:hypothetical protein [Peribacillus phoenicis]|uniref:hypothetical protein n=1 Tax=Peribacillus sp. 1P06PA-2 TaxID=3132295 RepID=UPI0039A5EB55
MKNEHLVTLVGGFCFVKTTIYIEKALDHLGLSAFYYWERMRTKTNNTLIIVLDTLIGVFVFIL